MSTSEGGAAKRGGLAVLIVIGVWGGSVIPAEIIFRLTGRQPADTILGYYEQFGDKGFKIKPFAQTRFNWWSGPFTVRTDALGLRIPDEADPADYDRRPDERLWLVLGDSQAFGNGVPYEKSVVGGMVGRAREEGVYIRNLAVGGYALENQFDLMQWYLDKTGHTPERILLFLTPRVIGDPEAARAHHRRQLHRRRVRLPRVRESGGGAARGRGHVRRLRRQQRLHGLFDHLRPRVALGGHRHGAGGVGLDRAVLAPHHPGRPAPLPCLRGWRGRGRDHAQ